MKSTLKIILTSAALLVCSCISSSKPTTSYILSYDLRCYPNVHAPIDVQEVVLPDYLSNISLVQRIDNNVILTNKYNQWGQNFRIMVKRLLAIEVYRAAPKLKEDYIVNVIFNRFEANGDKLNVDAVYLLTNSKTKQAKDKRVQFQVPWDTKNYNTLVKAHEEALKKIAADIAANAK